MFPLLLTVPVLQLDISLVGVHPVAFYAYYKLFNVLRECSLAWFVVTK